MKLLQIVLLVSLIVSLLGTEFLYPVYTYRKKSKWVSDDLRGFLLVLV